MILQFVWSESAETPGDIDASHLIGGIVLFHFIKIILKSLFIYCGFPHVDDLQRSSMLSHI